MYDEDYSIDIPSAILSRVMSQLARVISHLCRTK